jgi:hypothetical protein
MADEKVVPITKQPRTDDDRVGVTLEELGVTGLKHSGGYVDEEWLRELQRQRGPKRYREMRDNDPVVGGMMFAIEALIRRVKWRVEPGDKSAAAIDHAEFVDSCRDDMSHTWEELIAEILSFFTYGWSYFEVVYKRRVGPDERDASSRSRFDDGRYGWRKIAIRSQDSLDRWDLDEAGGVKGMWQIAPPKFIPTFIPIERSLLFRTSLNKGSPEGRSLLRNAYDSWFRKRHIQNIEGIGIERDLTGIPIVWVPPRILNKDGRTPEDEATYAAMKQLVREIKRDEQEGVVFPLAYDEGGRKRFDISLLSTGGRRQFETTDIVERHDARIAMSLLADFILLGHQQVGSFALSSSKTSLFLTALGGILGIIRSVFNRHEIPRLLRMNGISVSDPPPPTLEHGNVELRDLEQLGKYLQTLTAAGVPLFPNKKLEAELLSVAELPQPEEDEVKERTANEEAARARENENDRRELERQLEGEGPDTEAPEEERVLHFNPFHDRHSGRFAGAHSPGATISDRAYRRPLRRGQAKPGGGPGSVGQSPTKLFNHRTGKKMSKTEAGDTFEALAVRKARKHLVGYFGGDVAQISGRGKRQTPLDFKVGKYGMEMKTMSKDGKNLKTAIKKEEYRRKVDDASRMRLTPATTAQIVNQRTREVEIWAVKGDFVSRQIYGSGGKPTGSFDLVGKYRYTLAEFNAANATVGKADIILGDNEGAEIPFVPSLDPGGDDELLVGDVAADGTELEAGDIALIYRNGVLFWELVW